MKALSQRLRDCQPNLTFEASGYLQDFSLNLITGVNCEDFEKDLRSGDGNELAGKFKAPHSSSALAVNVFAPFRQRVSDLHLLGHRTFNNIRFEQKFPTGLRTRRAPNLDVVAEFEDGLIAIESKCTEYLSRKAAKFSPAYEREIADGRRNGPWFAEMQRLQCHPDDYRQLDAAQLLKHAFGLERHASLVGIRNVTLLYLYWEPINGTSFPIFREYRREIAAFASRVQGSVVNFGALSYPELWQNWRGDDVPWLNDHLKQIAQRYLIAL